MNKADILANAVTVEESSLSSLYYWLQYEKHSWILGGVVGWLPYHIVMMGLSILAVIFTPYMLWHLFRAKWYKSIATFTVFVALPFTANLFFEIENPMIRFLLNMTPFVTFYGYTYGLSYMITERLEKLKTLRRWEKERLIKSSSA